MPPKWVWFSIMTVCILALLLTAVFFESQRMSDDPPGDDPTDRAYRIIGVWEDRVAIYRPQEDTPERVYDTRVSSLPAEEQQKLQEGIAVFDSDTLKKRLEDYLS